MQLAGIREPAVEFALNVSRDAGELISRKVKRLARIGFFRCRSFAGDERGWFASAIIRGRRELSTFDARRLRQGLGRFSRAAWFPLR